MLLSTLQGITELKVLLSGAFLCDALPCVVPGPSCTQLCLQIASLNFSNKYSQFWGLGECMQWCIQLGLAALTFQCNIL